MRRTPQYHHDWSRTTACACNVQAARERYDAVIVDTAGRLQIDDRMMAELKATQRAIKPSDTLLVVDAMTGQEAASLTKAFNEAAEITGTLVVLYTREFDTSEITRSELRSKKLSLLFHSTTAMRV